ncbi:MAG: trehalose-phosphatase [Chloroflexi bacterium]|nr:trehalose-phosphatase [Chloroflexota bacterium]
MKHLFSAWPEVTARLREARHILVLSDYDGTLTPIVERPELAVLPEETRELLGRLAGNRRVTLGIISGRALDDLRQRVGFSNIIYGGNHGLEIEGPGVNFFHPLAEEIRPLLRLIYELLARVFRGTPAVLVEHKGLTLSVHYRLVEDEKEAEKVRGIFESILAGARSLGKIKITSGKKVLEVRPPVNWHKGKAVQLIMKKYSKGGNRSGALAFYLGDDLTDEDAFQFVEKGGGIPVFVGEENDSSAAGYFLDSPGEVSAFLKSLLEELEKQGPA